MEAYEKFKVIREFIISPDTLLDAVAQSLSTDELDSLCNHLGKEFDIDFDDYENGSELDDDMD